MGCEFSLGVFGGPVTLSAIQNTRTTAMRRSFLIPLVLGLWWPGSAGVQAAAGPPSRSKISVHLLGSYSAGARQIIDAHPPVLKILDTSLIGAARDYKASTPNGKTVLRIYTPRTWSRSENPSAAASNFWSTVLAPPLNGLSAADRALIDYVEGPNEADSTPTWASATDTIWYNDFWLTLARLIADAGFKPCAYSISVGNPPGSTAEIQATLDRIAPSLRYIHSRGGAWSYHNYTIQYTTNVAVENFYSLRHRIYYNYFAMAHPDLVDLPILMTEGGVDGAGAWSERGSAEMFQNWLVWLDEQLRSESRVLGVTLFQIGDTGSWGRFNVESLAGWIAARLNSLPGTNTSNVLPLLTRAVAESPTNLSAFFDQPVTAAAAMNPTNLTLRTSGGTLVPITSARLTNGTNLLLTTTAQAARVDHTLTVSNVPAVTQSPLSGRNGAVTVRVPLPLIPLEAATTWRYQQSGSDPGPAWRTTGYNDAAWPTGAPLLAYESAPLPEPIRTTLTTNNGRYTFYFRRRFDWPGAVGGAVLRLRTIIDDGAVFWLNGAELFRLGITNDPVLFTTPASRTVGDAVYEGPFLVSATLAPTNVLAAEVHQVTASSSDIVFGLSVEALVLPSQLPASSVMLFIGRQSNSVLLSWSAPGYTLESAPNVLGPWTAQPQAMSPFTVLLTNSARFFRLAD
jgi:hypothetical protein